jgi:hypothetical protein
MFSQSLEHNRFETSERILFLIIRLAFYSFPSVSEIPQLLIGRGMYGAPLACGSCMLVLSRSLILTLSPLLVATVVRRILTPASLYVRIGSVVLRRLPAYEPGPSLIS